MTDAIIPAPARGAICGTFKAGELKAGQTLEGDSYTDFPLALDGGAVTLSYDVVLVASDVAMELLQGTAEVLYGVVRDMPITVEATGYLDLLGDAALLWNERNLTVVVDTTGWLDLDGDDATLSTGITLTSADAPLDLVGGPITLFLDNTIRIPVEATPVLELVGGPVRVNPVLMPKLCIDLDLAAVTCTPLDLGALTHTPLVLVASGPTQLDPAPATVEEIDLVALDCLEA